MRIYSKEEVHETNSRIVRTVSKAEALELTGEDLQRVLAYQPPLL